MGNRALRKDFFREIKNTLNRFLSIFLIVGLGVAFFTGIRSAEPNMQIIADRLYDESNLMDIRIISTLGLTEDDLDAVRNLSGVEEAQGGYSADVLSIEDNNQHVIKIYSDLGGINKVSIKKGRLPKNENECFVDESYLEITGHNIGDKIKLKSGNDTELSEIIGYDEYIITGFGSLSYYLSRTRGSSSIGNGSVSGFIILPKEAFQMEVYTEIYLTVSGAKELLSYSDEYQKAIDEVILRIETEIRDIRINARYDEIINKAKSELADAKAKLSDAEAAAKSELPDVKSKIDEAEEELTKLKKPEWYVLNRNYLQSNAEFASDAERIGAIGKVFPVIFFLVAALVSLTTMTRMVEEERTQIGTMKALGYSKFSIASKYILYALLATIGGSVLGGIAGGMIIPYIIITAYKIMYANLGTVTIELIMKYFFMAGIIAVLCVVAATLFACYKELAAQPSELMRPPSPKQGKRVFMERITFIWKKLNFTGKSTVRNLIRYKKRFFMTVFGIGGCMALLLVGYGVKDSIFSISDLQFNRIRTYDGLIVLDSKISEDDILEVVKYINDDERIIKSTFIYETSIDAGNGKLEKEAQITVPKELEVVTDYFVFRDRITGEKYSISNEGVIITEKLAKLLDVSAGDTIYIKDSNSAKLEVKIDAVAENYVRHYIFMSPTLYQTLFNESVDYNEIIYDTVKLSVDEEEELTEDMLLLNGVTNNTILKQTAKSFDESMGNLDIITLVLIVSAGCLAFIVLYNLNNINISERKRELATLKILGFYDLEVSEYIFRENIILTVIGTILGIGLGIVLHRFVMITAEIDMVMFGRTIGFMSYVKSILLTCLFALIVNFSMHFKLRKIDMASSLKSVE